VGRVEETPPRGQHRHAAAAEGRVFQVASDGLEALVPDQAERAGGRRTRLSRPGDARPQAHGFPF
jgi:hypothetical protein